MGLNRRAFHFSKNIRGSTNPLDYLDDIDFVDRPQRYKTCLIANSTEHEIYHAHKF